MCEIGGERVVLAEESHSLPVGLERLRRGCILGMTGETDKEQNTPQ